MNSRKSGLDGTLSPLGSWIKFSELMKEEKRESSQKKAGEGEEEETLNATSTDLEVVRRVIQV